VEIAFGLGLLFLVLVPMAAIAFWVWALIDAIKVPHDGMYRAGDRLTWVLVIALLNVVGAIIYLVVGRPRQL